MVHKKQEALEDKGKVWLLDEFHKVKEVLQIPIFYSLIINMSSIQAIKLKANNQFHTHPYKQTPNSENVPLLTCKY